MTTLQRRVRGERVEAQRAGATATPFRPFASVDEQVGAFRCSVAGARHTPGRRTVAVSYLTGFPGRVALCRACLRRVTTDGRQQIS